MRKSGDVRSDTRYSLTEECTKQSASAFSLDTFFVVSDVRRLGAKDDSTTKDEQISRTVRGSRRRFCFSNVAVSASTAAASAASARETGRGAQMSSVNTTLASYRYSLGI